MSRDDAPAPPARILLPHSLVERRAAFEALLARLTPEREPVLDVQDARTPSGVPVRVYRPTRLQSPGILLAHGGAFTKGSLDSHDGFARRLANACGSVVVSVGYRLAPEHAFPTAHDDVHAAWTWLTAEAEALGATPGALGLAGDSAGGALVADLSGRALATARPRFQLLFCPVTDFALGSGAWNSRAGSWFDRLSWRMDLHGRYSGPRHLRSLIARSPLLLEAPAAWPATLVITAGDDPLNAEARAYADRLHAAGAPVVLSPWPGVPHGFMLDAARPESAGALRRAGDFVQRVLRTTPSGALGPIHPSARRAQAFLMRELQRRVSLDELAIVSRTSKHHLVRAFTDAYGLPPHSYHLARRLEAGRDLLVRGATVGEAAAALGFSDATAFIRHFRTRFGVPPARWLRDALGARP